MTISHYRVVEKLGEGGMGVVYKVRDTRLNRLSALKVLPPDAVDSAERRQRFKQEAQAASALNHPSIVTIYEIGDTDGTLFIAMEYVAGRTMSELIPHDGMSVDETLRYAVQIADAFAKAHAAGIVHRDLKPANLMVTGDGLVKVLDFGLAKLTERESGEDETTASAMPHTEQGIVLGTPAFMSPEQAAGQTVDARSDIFSFGSVLYEMVTGRRAFRGDSRMETVAAVLSREPEPLPSKVSPELHKVILRCLRKDPARRYQTMADLRVALEDLREGSVSGRRLPAPSSRRWIWAALLSMLLVAGFFAWRAGRAPREAPPLQAVALTTLPGVEQSPSFSPDGNHVVFAWAGPKQDNQDIYVQMVGQGSPLRLTTDPLSDYNPVWSPDGRWIAFFRGEPVATTGQRSREVRLIAPLGGPDRKLADVRGQDFDRSAGYLAWSADSKALVVTDSPGEGRPDALFVVSLETGEKRPLTSPKPPVLADTRPVVSPDGRSLVFLRRTSWGSGELHVVPLGAGLTAAGEPRRLTPAALRADFPAWMPDGKEIVYSARGGLWRLSVRQGSTPTRIPFVGEDGSMPAIARPQPGRPARLVYVRSFVDTNIWRIETSAPGSPTSSPPVMAISSTRPEFHCQFSPDGRRVAFTSGRSGESEVWVSDPDGSNAVQLTSLHSLETTWPHWSPDGQLLAFSSAAEGEFDIYVIASAGGKPRRLTSHPSIDIGPRFSRDGRWIYFASMRNGDFRVWKMPAAGGNAIQVTPNQARQASETWDGSQIYYSSVSVASALWRMAASGGDPVKVLDGVLWYNFYLLEKGAYYVDRLGGETRLRYLDFLTSTSTTVTRNLGEVAPGLTASPDGRTILFTRVDSSTDDLMLVENFR